MANELEPATSAEHTCFHCAEPFTAPVRFRSLIGGAERPMCCAGCKAVAEAISGAGLSAYYDQRAAPATRAAVRAGEDSGAAYDAPAFQKNIVHASADGSKEISLLISGVTCAACVWLIEHRLQSLGGVLEATINFTNLRARVRWDDRRVRLSGIIAAIRSVGYEAEPFDALRSAAQRSAEQRRSLWRLFIAAFGMMQVMMYALPSYLADGDMSADIESLMRWASLWLTLPVMVFSARPFFAGAWRDVLNRTVGMDVPIVIGLVVTFVASVYATIVGEGRVYFDSIAMFVFFLLAARYLEATVHARAAEVLDRVTRLLPAVATVLTRTAAHEWTELVAVAELKPGDRVVVSAGETVPADGIVESGASELDEALLTGESRAVPKRAGDCLIGGSINKLSRLVMRVERVGAQTVVAGIGRLLERAHADKPRIAQLADRIAARFTAAILIVAAVAGLAWWIIDPTQALLVIVTVLVITCPCALSLATPTALAAATGSLNRLGVWVTRSHALETLADATHFVFDKTGTVTTGQLELAGVMPLAGEDRTRCLALAAALESGARHPVAMALTRAAERSPRAVASGLSDAHDIAGEGVEATYLGRKIRIGRPEFVAAIAGGPKPAELRFVADYVQVVALGDECGWIALFTLTDSVRPEARALMRGLQQQGRQVWLLTGDRNAIAEHVGHELGADGVVGDARPEDKLAFVRRLQSQGAVVAMIGDGVNDAPVLAQAQVSIALGSGADLAQNNADLVLAECGLERLDDAVSVARKAQRVIKQNFAWALVYNAIAIPAAVFGYVTPLIASIGMALSSAVVVANALRAAHPALWRRDEGTPAGNRQMTSGSAYVLRAN